MKNKLFCLGLLSAACAAVFAQEATSPVAAAVQKAIDGNPEVAAKFNVFRASVDEIDVASGAFKPHIDINGDIGKRDYRNTVVLPYQHNLNVGGAELSISQLLWDGLATHNEVQRLSHAKLQRYFEFVDSTEQVGLEAARAYYDVVRYRKLVKLAEDNYVQHKFAFDQVQSRVKAGVGRGVDLEQVVARVALAESNLVTERANLHDVIERYRRIVGELPPAENISSVTMNGALPAEAGAALEAASLQSPAIAASIENLRSTRSAVEARKGAFQPRVEARVRGGGGKNFEGIEGQKRDATAEIVLNWNILNGGSDQARERQYASLLNEAANLRDKACNDVRQTVAIAFNDVRKLTEELAYLDRNVVSIGKARDAYRQQFDIGQRSLLDLLNAENELYTAQHSYVVAEEDLAIAVVRTYAGMGSLVSGLGLRRPDTHEIVPEAEKWASEGDASARCPLSPTDVGGTGKDELDARARALAGTRALPAPATTPTPSQVQQKISATITVQRLQDWAAAWMSKDIDRYMAFYGSEFKPLQMPKPKWLAERRRLVTKKGKITVELRNIETRPITDTRVEASFDQVYHSIDYNDTMHKILIWDRVGTEWKIVGETNR